MPIATYDASDLEVLKGLEPVRRRPGMYTQTERPNHLVLEVVDNAVDEAIAGHAREIRVTLHQDGSAAVEDDGRGMPVDRHKEEKVSGVEVIMTRLHAGAKFSQKNYRFSGGLHGVGVSVVNALSERLEVEVKRHGKRYRMAFAGGDKTSELEEVGAVGQRNTGTLVRFWPDPKYFDTVKIAVPRLKHALRAKAVLCPGLAVRFADEAHPENDQEWRYDEGLADYLADELEGAPTAPAEPYVGRHRGDDRELDWAVAWLAGEDAPTAAAPPVQESYVNLIPTPQGGTHVNGFRSGLTDAVREFCDFRDLLPRGVRLAPDDVWERCAFVLSLRLKEPQFSGQTKERLSNRDAATYVAAAVKDAFSLWLNQHTEDAEAIARLAIESAQARVRASKRVERKRVTAGPALPGKLADCTSQDLSQTELFLVEGDSAGGSAKQARDREYQAILPLRGKILNTWEVDPGEVLASQEVHHIAVALGVDPGSADLSGLRYGKVCILADADSDGAHIASLLCALFVQHFPALVWDGRVHVAMPPLYRIDVGKEVLYALDDAERERILESLGAAASAAPGSASGGATGEGAAKTASGARINVQRFKGLGEMNPSQLRETTMDPDTRRLVQLVLDGAGEAAGRPAHEVFDMLLSKKRAADRRQWLTEKGNLASTVEP
ncbi:MAG TPA: DNA topoisomerase IV subunit B [Thermoanaerobaculia bacterium]|nr:DNA topoisomerase IV subunit B [Thermoanaerobaculia bacterium]